MIEIILPYILNNEEFYNKMYKYSLSNKFHKNIKCYNIYGNFPWSYWHGGKSSNINTKEVIFENKITQIKQSLEIPMYFDLSNLQINELDLYDRKLNMILTQFNSGENKIICADLILAQMIANKYPYFNLIFSDNACLQLPFTNEIINGILESDFFQYIILNPNLIDKNFDYNNIIDKSKILIKIGCTCSNCDSYMKCIAQEHFNQYNFSENSVFEQCEQCKNSNLIFQNLKNEIDYYHDLGFTKFILDEPLKNNMSLDKYNFYLITNLLKEEYIFEEVKSLC